MSGTEFLRDEPSRHLGWYFVAIEKSVENMLISIYFFLSQDEDLVDQNIQLVCRIVCVTEQCISIHQLFNNRRETKESIW